MIYLKNWLLLILLKTSNKFGRGFYLKKRIFSSQNILEKNFPEKTSFNFIQVGANDGISFDFLYDFVTKRNPQGVVIEPVKDYFNELKQNYKNYPNIIKINKAVHSSQKEVEINRISPKAVDKYPDWVKGIASLDAEHHKKVDIDSNDIIKEEVIADTLMNIINQNLSNKKLDYFQIDTEGFDYEVIKMIDFECVKPGILKFESVHLKNAERADLEILLKNKGYYIFKELGDSVVVNLKIIKLY